MEIDWKRCIICQEVTSEALKCPMHSPGRSCDKMTDAYDSFLANVKQFSDINALPTKIHFQCELTADDFAAHYASWHKSCHLKYNNTKLAKAQKRRANNTDDIEKRPPRKRQAVEVYNCIFCGKGQEEGDLHQVSTFDADHNIRKMITELQDVLLLARIDGGDLMAKEVKYHFKCLTSLRNRYRSHIRKSNQEDSIDEGKMIESRVFVELVNYIEKTVESGTLLFKLSDIHSLYVNRLNDLGIVKTVNKTKLKDQLMKHFPEAQEQHDGRNTIIVFNKAMQSMLREALNERDFSEDAVILVKAALIIRNDVFNHPCHHFTGSFLPNCQEDSLPSSLKSLISYVFNGPNLKDQDKHESQACLTVSQIILFNMKKRHSDPTVKARHTRDREPPLPIYIGLNIHQMTRSKKLIQQFYQMGISVSYDRVLELEDQIATSVSKRFEEDGVVSPACLRTGLFTVGAMDNLDHNPSSTTAVDSFHGTGISLFQFPTKGNPGKDRSHITILSGDKQHSLPDNYTIVPAVALTATTTNVPQLNYTMEPLQSCLDEAISVEKQWIEHALTLMEKNGLSTGDALVWAAYHALQQPRTEDPPAVCALLPLFNEKSATPAMIKHGMDVQRQAIEFLNPGQIPVTVFDQPLFALAKLVQWRWPDEYGESVHVVMMGGLHIEMALWNTLGDLLEASGWSTALTEAEIASSGTADSFLKVSHLTRTRHAHQVTLLTLHKLQKKAFLQSEGTGPEIGWRNEMCQKSPTFMFWDLILRFETLILIFIRAHRTKNFSLYVEVLEELTPLFFALDHVNYSRWVPVHIRDMKSLPSPIRMEFEMQHHWVLSKTNNNFSAIPIDQAHEQENAFVKGAGGLIGLTENPTAFRRWMLSGPELARIQRQFEDEYLPNTDPDSLMNFQNHEQGLATQKTYQKQVNSLFNTIERMGNPFLDDFPELVMLDSRNCVDKSVANSLYTLEATGKQQYQDFVANVLENCTSSIHNAIKRNSLALFKRPQVKATSKQGKKIKVLQNNVALFGQLYISMQSQDGDLNEFFAHEIQSFPPSLSDLGKLHLPNTKSDLLKCLDQPGLPDPPSTYDCIVLDGAVVVHFLSTKEVSTFNEYADKVFVPYINKQLQSCMRVDIVWDTYIPDSLKESTREKRGKGIRRKVSGETKIPSNWIDFLHEPNNKKELFNFLTVKISKSTFPPSKAVYATLGESVVSLGVGISIMPNCNHEEADTRIVVHVLHALEQGLKSIEVRTVDTDVVVILAGAFFELIKIQACIDLWIAFGVGKNFKFYSVNSICATIGEPRSQALPVFHALTGCDTTSAFRGKGKKLAWQAWQVYEDVTETFRYLASHPFEYLSTDSAHFQKIERFTVILYDKTSPLSSVNEARKDLFCHKSRSIDRIPPTQNVLLQHSQRAVYQAGIWTTSTQVQQMIPSPQEFAWAKTSSTQTWQPVWMTIPEVSAACSELIKCSCKGDCTNCKCGKANLACSPLCNCKCNTVS